MKIILSDDNKSIFEPFKDAAFKLGIELIPFTDWESAQTYIEASGADQFIGAIIDGKGWLNADSKEANSKHVTLASQWLHEQKAKGNLLPAIIYTAYHESIKEFQLIDDVIIGIEDKGNVSFEEVLNKLKANHLKDPDAQLKFRYKEVLGVFNDVYLPKDESRKLIDLLNLLNEPQVVNKNFNIIRDLIEAMLKNAHRIDNQIFIPASLMNVNQGRPNLKYCEIYLSGRPVNLNAPAVGTVTAPYMIMPPHISRLFTYLTDGMSILSHNYPHNVTNFAYKNAVFGLCEVLLWYRDYCKATYNI